MNGNGKSMIRRPMAELATTLDRQRETIAKVAEPGTDMERLFGLVRFVLGQDRSLMQVLDTRDGMISVVRATTKLAQLGLEPTGKHGGAYLVKYGSSVQVLPDWRSYRDAAIDSGAAIDVYAVAIHANDTYAMRQEDGREVFDHDYDPFGDRGPRKGWMFVGITTEGPVYLPVTMEAIAKRRAQGNSGTWNKWPDEMERKTVIRMGCDQRLSVRNSRKLADLMAADDAAEVGDDAVVDPMVMDIQAEEPESRTSALRSKLEETSDRQTAEQMKSEPADAWADRIVKEEVAAIEEAKQDEPPTKGTANVLCAACESTSMSRVPVRSSAQGDTICVAKGHGAKGRRFFKLSMDTEAAFAEALDALPSELLDAASSALRANNLNPDGQVLWSDEHGQRALRVLADVVSQADAAQQDDAPDMFA